MPRLGKVQMRRLMPVGLWALVLAFVVLSVPGHHVLGARDAYAFDDPNGGSYDQDSGTGGGGGSTGASYTGDPDGPQAGSKSRTTPWYAWGGGTTWRGATVYGQNQVGSIGRVWTVRNLIVALRIYYLRF